jgi:hypothetical protein
MWLAWEQQGWGAGAGTISGEWGQQAGGLSQAGMAIMNNQLNSTQLMPAQLSSTHQTYAVDVIAIQLTACEQADGTIAQRQGHGPARPTTPSPRGDQQQQQQQQQQQWSIQRC